MKIIYLFQERLSFSLLHAVRLILTLLGFSGRNLKIDKEIRLKEIKPDLFR